MISMLIGPDPLLPIAAQHTRSAEVYWQDEKTGVLSKRHHYSILPSRRQKSAGVIVAALGRVSRHAGALKLLASDKPRAVLPEVDRKDSTSFPVEHCTVRKREG
jgi:hypothetical protein